MKNIVNLKLNHYKLELYQKDNNLLIWDIIRKKKIILTPEEWVRQNFIHNLINDYNYPKNSFSLEKKITVNNITKRFDILVYDKLNVPYLLVECKAPNINIDKDTLLQASNYNKILKAKYIIVTNGLTHFTISFDVGCNKINIEEKIPYFI